MIFSTLKKNIYTQYLFINFSFKLFRWQTLNLALIDIFISIISCPSPVFSVNLKQK